MDKGDSELRDRQRVLVSTLAARGIQDARVLRAMLEVPRHRFLPASLSEFAYRDVPLPIEEGQTISQPYIVAWMVQAAALEPGHKVLEVAAA